MIEMRPEHRLAVQALRDMATHLRRTEIAAVCERALAGDPDGVLKCGIAMGAVGAIIDDLLARWRELPDPAIHLLRYGRTPCGMPSPPGEWPTGHSWSGDAADITCAPCKAAL